MIIDEVKKLYAKTPAKLPAYRRIQLMITTQLESGDLKAGDPIPSENEFVNALGISRMTVNRAMRELSNEGLLKRTRGIGTFVAEEKFPGDFMSVHNIADEIKQRGHSHSQKLLKLEKINKEDDHEFWDSGQIPPEMGETAFHSVIVHFDDGVPFQIEERFVNDRIAPRYLEQNFENLPPDSYLNSLISVTHGIHKIDAILPNKDQHEILEIDSTEPCLRIERFSYSEEELVSAACLLHPGFRIVLEGEFGK